VGGVWFMLLGTGMSLFHVALAIAHSALILLMSDLGTKGFQCDGIHDVQSWLSASISSRHGHTAGPMTNFAVLVYIQKSYKFICLCLIMCFVLYGSLFG